MVEALAKLILGFIAFPISVLLPLLGDLLKDVYYVAGVLAGAAAGVWDVQHRLLLFMLKEEQPSEAKSRKSVTAASTNHVIPAEASLSWGAAAARSLNGDIHREHDIQQYMQHPFYGYSDARPAAPAPEPVAAPVEGSEASSVWQNAAAAVAAAAVTAVEAPLAALDGETPVKPDVPAAGDAAAADDVYGDAIQTPKIPSAEPAVEADAEDAVPKAAPGTKLPMTDSAMAPATPAEKGATPTETAEANGLMGAHPSVDVSIAVSAKHPSATPADTVKEGVETEVEAEPEVTAHDAEKESETTKQVETMEVAAKKAADPVVTSSMVEATKRTEAALKKTAKNSAGLGGLLCCFRPPPAVDRPAHRQIENI